MEELDISERRGNHNACDAVLWFNSMNSLQRAITRRVHGDKRSCDMRVWGQMRSGGLIEDENMRREDDAGNLELTDRMNRLRCLERFTVVVSDTGSTTLTVHESPAAFRISRHRPRSNENG